jgi:hypothetical protein
MLIVGYELCSLLDMSYAHYWELVIRKDMDVNEHERLSNITPRNKLK